MFGFSANPSLGAVSCVSQYGTITPYGTSEVCVKSGELQINKEVFNPNTKVNKFVDNVPQDGDQSYRFAPGEEVKFKLTIKNIGDNTLAKVQVEDRLPSFLEPVSGAFSFEITDLKVDQSVEREIVARVVPIDKLSNPVACDVNTAEVKSDDKHDNDTARICVEKKAAAQLPKAGATDTFAVLSISSLLGYLGLRAIRIRPNSNIA